jgi:hypothetical protein
VAACGVTLVAGFVKGAIGFAMPLIMISGLSLFLDPLVAIAGIILPIVLSNLMQVLRFSWAEARAAIVEYWRYILIVCVMIVGVAQFVTLIPTQTFYLILGVPVALSLIQLFGVRFHIPPQRRRAAEWGVGALAGGLGGLTGTWGPPTVLYLIALETPKAKQMLVQGVVYGLGSISLLAGHLQSGVLNAGDGAVFGRAPDPGGGWDAGGLLDGRPAEPRPVPQDHADRAGDRGRESRAARAGASSVRIGSAAQ